MNPLYRNELQCMHACKEIKLRISIIFLNYFHSITYDNNIIVLFIYT